MSSEHDDGRDGLRYAAVAMLALFAVTPSDRALAGWGIGSWPVQTLGQIAAGTVDPADNT